MKYITRILLISDETGARKAVTPKEPVGVSNLDSYRKEVRQQYPEFNKINFEYYEETA